MLVVLQLIGFSCSCYNNNCKTKLLDPDINFSIYTWFYWNCFHTVLYDIFQCYFHHYKIKFIIVNSYKNFKCIDSNHQLNTVKSFITYFSSDSFVSYQLALIYFLTFLINYYFITGDIFLNSMYDCHQNWLAQNCIPFLFSFLKTHLVFMNNCIHYSKHLLMLLNLSCPCNHYQIYYNLYWLLYMNYSVWISGFNGRDNPVSFNAPIKKYTFLFHKTNL